MDDRRKQALLTWTGWNRSWKMEFHELELEVVPPRPAYDGLTIPAYSRFGLQVATTHTQPGYR